MKRIILGWSIAISIILLTACSSQSPTSKLGAGDDVGESANSIIKTTQAEAITNSNTKASQANTDSFTKSTQTTGAIETSTLENTKAESVTLEDTDIGLRNIKIDNREQNLTDEQKLIVEYFDNDYFYLSNLNDFENLQRYPDVFRGFQINLRGIVKKVISYNEKEYKILLQPIDRNYLNSTSVYSLDDYVSYLGKRKNSLLLITGRTEDSRIIEGDIVNIFGRYVDIETVQVDSTSLIIPLVNIFRVDILTESIRDPDKFSPKFVKKVAKVIFGNDVEVRDPLWEEAEFFYKYANFLIVEPENQVNSKFTKFRIWTSHGSIQDAKVPMSFEKEGIERKFEFTPDLNNFIIVTKNYDQKTTNLDFYDKKLKKIWNREFEDTTSAVYDYTKNNIYLIANNELFVLDLKTGGDKIKPAFVGKKIEVRKLKDGLLVFAKNQSDAIMKLGFDGSILWKTSLEYNIGRIQNVQLNEKIVVSVQNADTKKAENHYLLIDSESGDISIDATSVDINN